MGKSTVKELVRLPWTMHAAACWYSLPPVIGMGVLGNDGALGDPWAYQLVLIPTTIAALATTLAIYSRHRIGYYFALLSALGTLLLNLLMPGIYGGLTVEAHAHGWPASTAHWVTAACSISSVTCVGALILLCSSRVRAVIFPHSALQAK